MGSRMKNKLPNWFYLVLALYLLVRLGRSNFDFPIFIKNYFTDLFCMPLVLMLCLLGARIIRKQSELVLNAWLVLFITVEYIVIFEIVLPNYSQQYTRDWLDGLMYLIGAIGFYFLQSKKKLELSN